MLAFAHPTASVICRRNASVQTFAQQRVLPLLSRHHAARGVQNLRPHEHHARLPAHAARLLHRLVIVVIVATFRPLGVAYLRCAVSAVCSSRRRSSTERPRLRCVTLAAGLHNPPIVCGALFVMRALFMLRSVCIVHLVWLVHRVRPRRVPPPSQKEKSAFCLFFLCLARRSLSLLFLYF